MAENRHAPAAGRRLSVICHGNIARSQALGLYLEQALQRADLGERFEVFSCGTVEGLGHFGDEEALLDQVRERLRPDGLADRVRRDLWTPAAARRVGDSSIVLVADQDRRRDVIQRLGPGIAPRLFLFYEFIGEGTRDFVDTYDPTRGAQDPSRFDACFAELRRIAGLVVQRLAVEGSAVEPPPTPPTPGSSDRSNRTPPGS